MIILNKYKGDKFAYMINKKYVLFIPRFFITLTWEPKQTFNLQDPVEKALSRINWYYEVLSRIDIWKDKISVIKLEELIKKDPENVLNWEAEAYQDQWEFYIDYDYLGWCRWERECEKDCIKAGYSEYQYWEHIVWLERWDEYDRYECYSKEEFNLLMQIYYGVYDDEILRKKLEEKERRWEYEEIKKLLNRKDMWRIIEWEKEIWEEEKKKLEEYLKLELMRKPTEWAFPELKIKKIYDSNWDEEEQKSVVDKINEELWKEVVLLE